MIFGGFSNGPILYISACSRVIVVYFLPIILILFGSNASIASTTLLSSSTQADGGVPSLVLTGATLLDGNVDPPKPNSMIIIQGDNIVSVTNEIGNNNNKQLMPFITSNNDG